MFHTWPWWQGPGAAGTESGSVERGTVHGTTLHRAYWKAQLIGSVRGVPWVTEVKEIEKFTSVPQLLQALRDAIAGELTSYLLSQGLR